MNKMFDLSQVSLQGHVLSFKVNGTPIVCDLAKISEVLAHTGVEQVAKMTVDPVGVGFHWSELDEDISLSGILKAQGIQVRPKKSSSPHALKNFNEATAIS